MYSSTNSLPVRHFGAAFLCLCSLAQLAVGAEPQPGAAPTWEEIRIGMSAALSGPTQSLGRDMQRGIEARFARLNRDGSLGRRRLRLIVMDDGYEPSDTRQNMLELIEQHGVLAVMGNVGTPTAAVAVPVANERKTLLFGAMTGASLLRKSPADRYVINYRASYPQETAAMVNGLLKAGVRPLEIAFFSQADAYGDAGLEGALAALARAGFPHGRRLAHGVYQRNTTDIRDAIIKMLDADTEPKAVIMIGTYAPSAKFIGILRRVLPNSLFINISFVGSEAMAAALGDQGEGVIVTQVVPHYHSQAPLCREYLDDYDQLFPNAVPNFVSLEGYVVAAILGEAIRRGTGPLTRENMVEWIEELGELDIGLGETLRFGPDSHQGSHHVWPTVLRNGRFEPFAWERLEPDKGIGVLGAP